MFVSYRESIVNLNHVVHVQLFENEIHFMGNSKDPQDQSIEFFETWYFVSDEEAETEFKKLCNKACALVL